VLQSLLHSCSMEYDVLEGCSDMDWSSWMIGDRAWERALKRRRGKVHKHGTACTFGALCREMSCNSTVQMINGQLM
jgi:hypothetical protein